MESLSQPFEIQIAGRASGPMKFNNGTELIGWLDRELDRWPEMAAGNRALTQLWNAQPHTFRSLKNVALEIMRIEAIPEGSSEKAQLKERRREFMAHATGLGNGNILTSDHAAFPRLMKVYDADPEAAVAMLLAYRSDAFDRLSVQTGAPYQPLPYIIRAAVAIASSGKASSVSVERTELQQLRTVHTESVGELGREVAILRTDLNEIRNEHARFKVARDSQWTDEKKTRQDEWDGVKRKYVEQMKLESSSHYWQGRATSSSKYAIGFGVLSVVFGLAVLALFATYGLSYVKDQADKQNASALLAIIPIVVPAFLAVWALRIFTRLTSDNLQMARDARERVTMVQTFISLLSDKTDDRAKLTEDDRILILHSLFRPSAIASVDDSPPIHWFDLLMKRQADAAKNK